MKKCCLLTLATLAAFSSFGQLQILAGPNTIDFDDFSGTGFAPSPAAGQLDSDTWRIEGLSDNPSMAFGDTETTGDFARGASTGDVSTGGVYSFDVTGAGDDIVGIQPGGSDFTSGTITLRIQNNTGAQIQELAISYDIFYFNDEGRSNSLNFSHSSDDVGYTTESSVDFSTPEAVGASVWNSESRNLTITGLTLANGSSYYLRWSGDDVSGSGFRDEYGLNDIVITPATDATTPPQFENGTPTITGITAIDFDLTSRLDEIGTSFFVVLADGAAAPTSNQVVAGTDAADLSALSGSINNSTAGADFTSTDFGGFADNADYDVYVVAQDDEGTPNVQTTPTLVEISVPALEDIAITEFLYDATGTDTNREWIEIYNFGFSSVDLNGWTVTDDGTNNATVSTSSLTIAAGDYMVLGLNKAEIETVWFGGSSTGGVVQFESGSFQLTNTTDEIILNNADGKEVWRLAYDATNAAEGRATFFNYADNSTIRDFGDDSDPGVVRNGNDDPGILGYEGNDISTDSETFIASNGDIGSPLAGNYGNPLPVELSSFDGEVGANGALLSWTTESELNNHGFYVEKSSDGNAFESIGFVNGNGTTNTPQTYIFGDAFFSDMAFYRLHQEDFDGSTEYSKIIYLEGPQPDMIVYPNPFSNRPNILGAGSERIQFSLIDPSGKRTSGNLRYSELQAFLESLTPGVYHLSLQLRPWVKIMKE